MKKPSKKLALLIGNNQYESLPNLTLAENDANLFRSTLLDPEAGDFDEVNVLLDSKNSEIQIQLEQVLTGKAQFRDVVFNIFFQDMEN